MLTQIEAIRENRAVLLEQLKELTTGQLNLTAIGFNNNIIWNLGHMIVVQQGICYRRAGLPMSIGDDLWHRFKSGSAPRGIIYEEEIASIKQLLIVTLDQLESDYKKQIFHDYTTWVTRLGVELASIDDAIKFLGFHDGLHLGVIRSFGFIKIIEP
jgi:hypothetical protein